MLIHESCMTREFIQEAKLAEIRTKTFSKQLKKYNLPFIVKYQVQQYGDAFKIQTILLYRGKNGIGELIGIAEPGDINECAETILYFISANQPEALDRVGNILSIILNDMN